MKSQIQTLDIAIVNQLPLPLGQRAYRVLNAILGRHTQASATENFSVKQLALSNLCQLAICGLFRFSASFARRKRVGCNL